MSGNLACHEEFCEPFREELIGGKTVMMSPRPNVNHNMIAENISFLFRLYLRGKKCVPLGDGYDLFLTEKDQFVPDFMLVCDRSKIRRNGVYGAPDLVAEVLSPSTAKNDRGPKMAVYQSCGVPEYWIVGPADHSVEVYLLHDGHYVLDNVYTQLCAEDLEAMTDKERAEASTEFKCHLYDDLTIRLEDIFTGLF